MPADDLYCWRCKGGPQLRQGPVALPPDGSSSECAARDPIRTSPWSFRLGTIFLVTALVAVALVAFSNDVFVGSAVLFIAIPTLLRAIREDQVRLAERMSMPFGELVACYVEGLVVATMFAAAACYFTALATMTIGCLLFLLGADTGYCMKWVLVAMTCVAGVVWIYCVARWIWAYPCWRVHHEDGDRGAREGRMHGRDD